MKRAIAVLLLLLICTFGIVPSYASAEENSNPVPKAKQAVVFVAAGIYFDSNGQRRTYDGSWSSGTAFGVGAEGAYAEYFVTNRHVVAAEADDASTAYDHVYICLDNAELSDESTLIKCEVVYVSEGADLAIIRAPGPVSGVTTLPLLPAEMMETGDPVYALGYPGFTDDIAVENNYTIEDVTVTDGIVSRYIVENKLYTKLILHTANINHGNSGGPLINAYGQVIGINTYGYHDYTELPLDTDGDGKADDYQYYSADKRLGAIYIDYAMEALDQLGVTYTDASQSGQTPSGSMKRTGSIVLVGAVVCAAAVLMVVFIPLKKKKTTDKNTKEEAKNKAAVSYSVYAVSGPMQGDSWKLKSKLLIGRDPKGDIVYPAETPGVSRNHCQIDLKEGQVYLTDLESKYGTYIDGKKLSANKPVKVDSKTEIALGSSKVRLEIRADEKRNSENR